MIHKLYFYKFIYKIIRNLKYFKNINIKINFKHQNKKTKINFFKKFIKNNKYIAYKILVILNIKEY